jgi:transposase
VSAQTKKKYSIEFKEEAVKLVTEQGYKVSEAARNLGIRTNMLSRWKREFEEEGISSRSKPVDAELKQLREENRKLKMEKEILKKAAAFFANESR